MAAANLERAAIEQDLAQRARRSLSEGGLHWAEVTFNGRDANLRGSASDDSQPGQAEAALRQLWGVRNVDNNAVLPPKVEPFLWSARRRGNRVRLSGYVPNRQTRQVIIGMLNAALPGLEVDNRMNVARGVPPTDTWTAGVSFALKLLASLKRGEVRLEDLALSISGEAEDAEAYQALSAALRGGLPKGVTLASAQIAAPVVSPYTWSAQFAGGQLVLSGYVTGESARAEVLAAAAAAPAGTDIVDRMAPAEGAPAGFAGAAAALVKGLVRLQSGSAEMKDTALIVAGIAADEVEAEAVRAGLRAAAQPPFKLTDQLRVAAPKSEPKPEPERAPPAPADPQGKPAVPSTTPETPAAPLATPAPPVEPKVKARTPASSVQPQPKVAAPASAPPAQPQPKVAAPAPAPPAQPQPKVAAPAPAPPVQPQPEVETASPPPSPEPQPPQAAPVPQAPAPAPSTKTAAASAAIVTPQAQASACRETLRTIAGAGPILFDSDSAALHASSFEMLNRLAAAARQCPGVRIAIEGHADVEGSAEYNQRLSARRAQVAVAYLVKAGADAGQLEAVGFGSSRPAAPNNTVGNKAKNRRIEIVVRP